MGKNMTRRAFITALSTGAAAAGTTPDRVEVHTVHQHDAPICGLQEKTDRSRD